MDVYILYSLQLSNATTGLSGLIVRLCGTRQKLSLLLYMYGYLCLYLCEHDVDLKTCQRVWKLRETN